MVEVGSSSSSSTSDMRIVIVVSSEHLDVCTVKMKRKNSKEYNEKENAKNETNV